MKLITGHDLLTGKVVYLSASGAWRSDIAAAQAFSDEDAQAAVKRVDPTAVVNAYMVEIEAQGTPAKRERLRETIRASGPSVRLDLGKQAGGGA